jgi:phospholipid/cholesterol/gamma-HCH transport system ATP-binding protein
MTPQGSVKLVNLSKSFNTKRIVDHLNLEVSPGEKICIIGPSGCGKSTLLRLMMGLHMPDSGHVYIDNEDVRSMDKLQLQSLRKHFGMLFQSAALFDSLNVEDNVAFPLVETFGFTNPKEIRHRVMEVLELVEMDHARHKMPSELSGGQRKRVGLARAIVASPQVIMYDEPTTGLDPILSTNIEDLIVKLNQQMGATSIVVTHQISTILRTGDKIYLMKDGTLLPPETPTSIRVAQNEYGEFLKGHV